MEKKLSSINFTIQINISPHKIITTPSSTPSNQATSNFLKMFQKKVKLKIDLLCFLGMPTHDCNLHTILSEPKRSLQPKGRDKEFMPCFAMDCMGRPPGGKTQVCKEFQNLFPMESKELKSTISSYLSNPHSKSKYNPISPAWSAAVMMHWHTISSRQF